MTKAIRVENADTSDWKVVVQVFDRGLSHQVTDPVTGEVTLCYEPDTLVKEYHLDHPTAMTPQHECYITSTRYLVVKEA